MADLIKAGALGSICTYHAKIGGKPGDWPKVVTFALREFRDIDASIVERLVDIAKRSRDCAEAFAAMPKHCRLDKSVIPGIGCE